MFFNLEQAVAGFQSAPVDSESAPDRSKTV
jgi:hypothetical protein